jgi:hypothetical protein
MGCRRCNFAFDERALGAAYTARINDRPLAAIRDDLAGSYGWHFEKKSS